MAVALVMDFPGGTREQYDQVVGRMDLGGRMPPGGRFHAAGATDGGWRVVDVWDSMEQFERFADEQIKPLSAEAGMSPPRMRVVELHNVQTGDQGGEIRFLQVLDTGMDAATYDEIHAEIAGTLPEGVVWHVAGPSEDGWCIIDTWTSKDRRDRFVTDRAIPAMQARGVEGPPKVDDLDVQATLETGARAVA